MLTGSWSHCAVSTCVQTVRARKWVPWFLIHSYLRELIVSDYRGVRKEQIFHKVMGEKYKPCFLEGRGELCLKGREKSWNVEKLGESPQEAGRLRGEVGCEATAELCLECTPTKFRSPRVEDGWWPTRVPDWAWSQHNNKFLSLRNLQRQQDQASSRGREGWWKPQLPRNQMLLVQYRWENITAFFQ